MILMPKQNWFRLLFVWNDGSVLRSISPQLFLMAIVSSVAVATHGRIFGAKIPLNTTPFTLFGLTLAIFLAFRNNASYQRFDEARRLWGNMLISARELTSQIICYVPASTDKIALAHSLVAFVYSLKHQLRGTDSSADLIRLLGRARTEPLRKRRYQPVALLNAIRCDSPTCRVGGSLPAHSSGCSTCNSMNWEKASVDASVLLPRRSLLHTTYCFTVPCIRIAFYCRSALSTQQNSLLRCFACSFHTR